MRSYILVLILLFSPLSNATAETPADILSGKTMGRIENYLNGLKHISADFIQTDDYGNTTNGKILIVRPGRMRVTYDLPSHDFIICDGSEVHIWNDELKTQTNIDEESSIANFILRDPIQLRGETTITSAKESHSKIEITLAERADPGNGSLTLVFENNPLILRSWLVHGPDGRTTQVALRNIREDASYSDRDFTFVPPNFGKGAKSR